jgi:hypothetical protein
MLGAMNEQPAPPAGLKRDGLRLWQSVTADFELHQAELDILARACRTADYITRLDRIVEHDGIGVGDRVHPALVESRLQSQLLARLLVALRIPSGDEESRSQYRGVRGFYKHLRADQRRRLEVVK